jgi:hypothetical protein
MLGGDSARVNAESAGGRHRSGRHVFRRDRCQAQSTPADSDGNSPAYRRYGVFPYTSHLRKKPVAIDFPVLLQPSIARRHDSILMTEPKLPANHEIRATWSGRFAEPVSDLVKRYTASVFFDRRMWRQDIRASLAHARMLAAQGIIGDSDLQAIEQGMASIGKKSSPAVSTGTSMTKMCI